MAIIKKTDIDRWASDNISARSDLPALIRGLVHATAAGIESIDFPAYESVNRSGFDGTISCTDASTWVPSGQSIWELSVQKNLGSKANDDYEKRTENTDLAIRKSSTYIALNARHWEKKAQWKSEVESRGEWAAVRAYDADDLEQWIEQAPAVSAWFGELINLPIAEYQDHETKWNKLTLSTSPSLTPEVFLASRDSNLEQIEKWLVEPASFLGIVSPFPEDALDFVSAVIESQSPENKNRICSHIAYVETIRAYRNLVRSNGIRSLIASVEIELSHADIAAAIEKNIRVIRILPPHDPQEGGVLRIERIREHLLANELKKCRLPEVVADQKAHDSGGVTTLLKKSLSQYATPRDEFSISDLERGSLRACLLLGGWDGQYETDRAIVEQLSGKSYDDVEIDCRKWTSCRSPFLLSSGKKWRLISKGEAWSKLIRYIPSSAVDSAVPLAIKILADLDPAYDLPDEERWSSRIFGIGPQYSSTIKRHVAETLAFTATYGSNLDTGNTAQISRYAYRVVLEVLTKDTPTTLWASFHSLLSLLAEASPEHYLRVIEEDLQLEEPRLAGLFRNRQGHPLLTGCDYTGLLWSLETLAWSKDYVTRVCRILMKLHKFHIPSNYANKPMASLTQILSCGMPYTTISAKDRIQLIKRLVVEEEQNGWLLLTSLFEEIDSLSTMNSRPSWQDWASNWEHPVSIDDFEMQLASISEIILGRVETNARRWIDILHIIPIMPRNKIEQTLVTLKGIDPKSFNDEDRKQLCKRIDEFVSRYRIHLKTSKKIKKEDLDLLESVVERLQPVSLSTRHAWLFDHYVDHFMLKHEDIKDGRADHQKAKIDAVVEILKFDGIEGIIELAKQTALPFEVGTLLSKISGDKYTDDLIPSRITEENWSLNLALGYVSNRHEVADSNWIQQHLERCEDSNQRAWLLAMLPFGQGTWDLVDSQEEEIRLLYWQRVRHWGVERDAESASRCSQQLIAVGRLAHAVDVICAVLHDDIPLQFDDIVAPLEAIEQAEDIEHALEELKDIKSYEVGTLLTAAQESEDRSEDRLFKLELNYLKMLDSHSRGRPITLFARLESFPEFFVELLSYVFKSENEDIERDFSEDEHRSRKAVADAAYRLLREWDQIPGMSENSVDGTILQEWVRITRNNADELGYTSVCDSQLGQLFSNAPFDEDGSWPCATVVEIMEEIANDRFATGFYTGIINSRGVVWRKEGGTQERELAAKYRNYADRLTISAPFVSSIFCDLERRYLAEAKEHDADEEWEK